MQLLLFVSCVLLLQGGLAQHLCQDQDALYTGDVGHRYHPLECDRYLHCHRDQEGTLTGVYRACRYAYFWNQVTKSCQPHRSVNCIIDQCTGGSDPAMQKMEGGGCRAYWRCQNTLKEAVCCSAGQRFIEGQGCVNDYTCMDSCPGECADTAECHSGPNWEESDQYLHYQGAEVFNRNCPAGTIYDVQECGCVSNVFKDCRPTYAISDLTSRFSANWVTSSIQYQQPDGMPFTFGSSFTANIDMGTVSGQRPFLIKFTYKELPFQTSRPRMRFLSSTACDKCNEFNIDVVGSNMEATIYRFGKIYARVSVSLLGLMDEWKNVALIYDGKELTLAVRANNKSYINRVMAPKLKILDCGAMIGSDTNNPLYGNVRSISFSTCLPHGTVADLVS